MKGRQPEKFERLYLTYIDKMSVAETMRKNLASDIIAGYGLANVTRQMVEIETYEKTVVKKAKEEYESYRNRVAPNDYIKREQDILKWVGTLCVWGGETI